MNIVKNALIVLLFGSATAMAAPASESSIKQLLAVTQAQKLLDGSRAQVDAIMNNDVQQSLNGKTPNAKQQQVIDNMKNRMIAAVQGELGWEKLEPIFLRLYRDTFTEEEIGGMLSFYKTPTGQAVINKMPLLMQNVLTEVQKMSTGLSSQMQKIQQDFAAEMKAAEK
ncbi:MAG TPA: DUF2059 domain-containing protein [Burkholderiales bacterium]|nr:DUF2059 domain-containing protein [Burkholderiales bacterium]